MGAGWGDPCELCPRQNTCEYQWGRDETSVFLIPYKHLPIYQNTEKQLAFMGELFGRYKRFNMCSFFQHSSLKVYQRFIKVL